jgi:uncharacterized protein (DUF1330 family)
MTAYFILTQTVTDPQRYRDEYIPGVMPFLAKYKAEVLVGDFDAKPLEGRPAKGVVVLRFPSEQAVRDFVGDPDYQPIKKIRLSITTDACAVMAPAFTMPG